MFEHLKRSASEATVANSAKYTQSRGSKMSRNERGPREEDLCIHRLIFINKNIKMNKYVGGNQRQLIIC